MERELLNEAGFRGCSCSIDRPTLAPRGTWYPSFRFPQPPLLSPTPSPTMTLSFSLSLLIYSSSFFLYRLLFLLSTYCILRSLLLCRVFTVSSLFFSNPSRATISSTWLFHRFVAASFVSPLLSLLPPFHRYLPYSQPSLSLRLQPLGTSRGNLHRGQPPPANKLPLQLSVKVGSSLTSWRG